MKNWRDRILVIAPHADDETLGCGGMIVDALAQGAEVHVAIVTMGRTPIGKHDQPRSELVDAMRVLGVPSYRVMFEGAQGRLDTMPRTQLIAAFDTLLEEFKPTAVFLPYASHHQDHEAVYRAMLAALRPREVTLRLQLVALYEYPYAATWPPPELPGGKFHFAMSDAVCATKLKALAEYRSQFERATWLTPERAHRWCLMRGAEIDVQYAEVFWLIRGTL